MSEEEIYGHLRATMNHLFEVDETDVVAEAKLYDDLDIDSIDAVNLIIELKRITGIPIHAEKFREARTVQNVVNTISLILQDHEQERQYEQQSQDQSPSNPG